MSEAQAQMQYIPLDELEHGCTRYIRENVVEEIKERIESDGYNPARPLRVIPENGHYVVADGNHRLETLNELREAEHRVPCVVEEDGDLYEIARESNRDEDTYAPEDLFDHLYKIDELRDEHTQAEIAEIMGEEWSRDKVKDHARVLSNVGATILDQARCHQKGRAPRDGANAPTFDFTEGWFRTSGLYDLDDEWQEQFMEWFVNEKNCKAGKGTVTGKVDDLADIQRQLDILNTELNEGVDDGKTAELEDEVLSSAYTDDSLRDAIEAANLDAQDQAYYGADSVEKLQEFEDNKIACVVTDPPYGVDYENYRDNDRPEFGEDAPDALDLLYDVLEELKRVCKANAHLYVFFPTKLYPEFRDACSEFFEVEEVPLVWVKNNITPNGGADGYKKRYAGKYETVFHLRAENGDSRELNGGSSANVLEHARPGENDRWHDSQKPISLWEELLTNSTGAGETIMDPFAGSGSALLAAKRSGRHYIGIEQDDSYESRFKKELRKIEDGGDGDE